MDVFGLRDDLVGAYRDYATSFMRFRDGRIRDEVEGALDSGRLWPHPSVGLNPSFQPGKTVAELVEEGVLHPGTEPVFRLGKNEYDPSGIGMCFHSHQEKAIRVAASDRNYVLTTGTGSGKSLAYIVPIVDHVLRNREVAGVKAIVVYPMNALVNSQREELKKFLDHGPWIQPPVTFARYTGQDDRESREHLRSNPPDILLTNYVMLELILTRYTDRSLVRSLGNLRFLVLDELHSYRGRQGADVALLVRRVREASGSSVIRCVGTSATLSTEGDHQSRMQRLAEVGSRLFGAPVEPGDIIGETLRRVTSELDFSDETVTDQLTETVNRAQPPNTVGGFQADPLSCWIESQFGIGHEDGRLVRAVPSPIEGQGSATERLAGLTGLDESVCERAIRLYLLAGNSLETDDGRNRLFPFRLHQFISRGDTVYASVEPPGVRHLSLSGERFVPGSDQRRVLLPLVFCRECGQDYYMAHLEQTTGGDRLTRRNIDDNEKRDKLVPGFLCVNDKDPWPNDPELQEDLLPPEWFDPKTGRLRHTRQEHIPRQVVVASDGRLGVSEGTVGWWTPAPFGFCLACRVSYSITRSNDFARLSTLGAGGRASATTVMSLAAVQHLRTNTDLEADARKMLSFTDNRQDASLQAGHFNDFVEVTMLRSALWRAASSSSEGLRHDRLPQKVFEALALPPTVYARDPNLSGYARRKTDETMREVLAYRLYSDLKRGWRIAQPNLEQVGLLEIGYESLSDLAGDRRQWVDCHPALAGSDAQVREHLSRVLLDSIRRDLGLRVKVLNSYEQESLKLRAAQWLTGSWSLDGEALDVCTEMTTHPITGQGHNRRRVGARGLFGRFLRRQNVLGPLPLADTEQVIREIFERLRRFGLLTESQTGGTGQPRWQIPAGVLVWRAGDGTRPYIDHLRVARPSEETTTNTYFVDLYRNSGTGLHLIEGREHTAQVSYPQRMEREDRFRRADLPVLFCSPTMELGVDIARLNVVNMRNVPPTPANYAQRSGRAGRGGQPALVFTYCSSGNSHDQHFFRRPEKMISGQVEAPRIDLINEDLLRAHVHAIWLATSRLDLGKSMGDVLDLSDSHVEPSIKPHVREVLGNRTHRANTRQRAKAVLADLAPDLHERMSADWLDVVLSQIPASFEQALERWKTLYMAALAQVREQNRIVLSANRSAHDQKRAKRLWSEAGRQLDVLRAEADSRGQSDFYIYRYFASEGFLPGYSFPRLPLSAFIPGRAGRHYQADYVQRPRFLAISEFGPQTYIYHEGARYQITRVILSRETDTSQQQEAGLTEGWKRCDDCGYMHPSDRDICEQCRTELPPTWTGMLRMRNVSTRRRERITSDEERRRRVGYELVSGFQFAERDGRRSAKKATVSSDTGEALLELSYGDTATVWRVNVGWRNRKHPQDRGFYLDTERGEWLKRNSDPDPERSATIQKVVPYVWDSRNTLVIEPGQRLETEEMASLEAVLKAAMQVVFQLESSELSTEPLPTRDDRRLLLFYESAEGGAGALRRLVDDPTLWQRIAAEGIRICHQDPEAEEHETVDGGCGGACYECLLTYQNQLDHELLNRNTAVTLLRPLLGSCLRVAPPAGGLNTESTLESEWIDYMMKGGYRMPDRSQVLFKHARTRPDFVYSDECVAVYVDGPHHDYPDRAARDQDQEEALLSLGYRTIRFGYRDDWDRSVGEHRDVFGAGNKGSGGVR